MKYLICMAALLSFTNVAAKESPANYPKALHFTQETESLDGLDDACDDIDYFAKNSKECNANEERKAAEAKKLADEKKKQEAEAAAKKLAEDQKVCINECVDDFGGCVNQVMIKPRESQADADLMSSETEKCSQTLNACENDCTE